jgi:hypothetical protein
MGLVLPTDHGSVDTWDTIFDTSYQLIDAHDHTTGKGVKVPVAALNVTSDVSWSSGGTSHAITDLVAIDFAAVASSAVTALAGALWLNSADSNLYWRTPGGSNVQLTDGAALNVSAFTGGIGGDYAGVGALVIFDDATDSYWFQQQIGAGVRQYARMRNADVDLYEYKANPAAGVPTNRVRLASPTSLAASYQVTFPASVPGATVALQMGSTGVLTASNAFTGGVTISGGAALDSTSSFTHGQVWPMQIQASAFAASANPGSVGTYQQMTSNAGFGHVARSIANSASIHASLTGLRSGDRIVQVNVNVCTGSGITTIPQVSITIVRDKTGTGTLSVISATIASPGSNEAIVTASGAYTVATNDNLYLEVLASATAINLFVIGATVFVDHP